METTGALNGILEQQEAVQSALREEIDRLEGLDFVTRNKAVEKELLERQTELEHLRTEIRTLAGENGKLKDTVIRHAYREKEDDIRQSEQRYRSFAELQSGGYSAHLKDLENWYKREFENTERQIGASESAELSELHAEFAETRAKINTLLKEQWAEFEEARAQKNKESAERHEAIRRENLTEEEIKSRASRANMELKIGGWAANVFGILLVLIGVVVALQSGLLSGIAGSAVAYLLGIIFLSCGELLSRKQKTIFSVGLTAGGIAILFASTAVSYFLLGVVNLYAAFGICGLTAAAALMLSIRYKSATIANFALIGGFLPLYTIFPGGAAMLYSLMLYLTLLNFFAMLISAQQDWRSVKYISFLFNTIAVSMILSGGNGSALLNLGYVSVSFAMYVFIAVIYPIRKQQKPDGGTFVVMILNSLVNCGFVFGILQYNDWGAWLGLTAVLLGAFYYIFSVYLSKRMTDGKLSSLFLVTGLVFGVLAVPLQFDAGWLVLGWLTESALLIVAGIFTEEKWYKRFGAAVYSLSIFVFLLWDTLISRGYYWRNFFYLIKATAIVATGILIFAAEVRQRVRKTSGNLTDGNNLRLMKYYLVAICYIYLLYLADFVLYNAYRLWRPDGIASFGISWPFRERLSVTFRWELSALRLVFSACYARFLTRLRSLRDSVTDGGATVLFIVCALWGFGLNENYYGYFAEPLIPFVIMYTAFNLCGFIAAWECTSAFVRQGKISPQIQPLVLFSYVLAVSLEMLTVQAGLAANDMILSFVLAAAAVVYILHGFLRSTPYTRRAGLGLAVTAVIKFFIVDLAFLAAEQKILSYFVLGISLIAISYVYQHFAKRVFELDEVSLADAVNDAAIDSGENTINSEQ